MTPHPHLTHPPRHAALQALRAAGRLARSYAVPLLLAVAGLATVTLALAQPAYPARAVTVVVAFPPGSGLDGPARIVAEQLSQSLKQAVVVENRAGAGGTVAAGYVARAPADGYTLLFNSSAQTLYPSVFKGLSFDPAKDLVPVVAVGRVPLVLVSSPDKGWRSVKDLVAYAKSKPGALTYASAGLASTTHLSFERLRSAAGFTGVHVPFKGTPEALTEVVAGRVDALYVGVSAAISMIQAGKLVPLAVGERQRLAALPDVPTTLEAGFADSDYPVWAGLFAPAGTPAPVLQRLHQETARVLAQRETVERFAKLGLEPITMGADEFRAKVRSEFAINDALVKAAGIKPE